jgi:hypothetical protein
VQRGDDRNSAGPRRGRQVEREVQQIVHVKDVRLHDIQHLLESCRHQGRTVGLLEGGAHPVIGNLDDGHLVVEAPGELTVRARRVVVSADDGDVMAHR